MAATRITGSDTDFRTKNMIKNIAIIETALTVLKSLSVIVIRSFVQGASPITIDVASYFLAISSTLFIWSLISSDANVSFAPSFF